MDALVLTGDEGRGKLRKAPMSCKQALLIGDVRMGKPNPGNAGLPATEYIGCRSDTQGSETSHYLKEKKSNEIP